MTPARRRRLALAAAALGLVLALAAGEVAVRALGIDASPRRHFHPGIYRPDPELGWALLPDYAGVHVEYTFEAPTTTGPLGYRTPPWTPARAGARRRVLCLGDSCTFGRGVADDATWPARLEAALRARGEDAAVFDAGVPGYDTVQEERVLARLEGLVRPTEVIVAWLPNDVTERSVDQVGKVQLLDGQMVQDVDAYRAWRDRAAGSALWRLLRVRLKLLKDALGARRGDWRGGLDDAALAYSQAPLRRLVERTRALGARPLVVLFPRQEEVEDPAVDPSHHARMAAFARGLGVEVVDLCARWRGAPPAAGRYLPRDAVHLTAAGYDEVARAVAEALPPAR